MRGEQDPVWRGDDAAGSSDEAAAMLTAYLFDRVSTIADALTDELSTSQIIGVLMYQGMAGLGAAGAAVALVDPGGFLAYVGAVGAAADLQLSSGIVPLDRRTPMAQAALTRNPVFVSTAAEASEGFPDITADREGCRAYAAVPLQVGGRTVGVLGVTFRDERAFSHLEQRFITTVANIGAHALLRDLSFRHSED